MIQGSRCRTLSKRSIYVGWLAGSGFFSEHSKHMFHPKHIAAVLIAMCLASTGDAASRLEPPGAAEKVSDPAARTRLSIPWLYRPDY